MIRVNDNFLRLPSSYLFSTIASKVAASVADHPDREIVRMGIGDVTRPLCPAAIKAMEEAVGDLATEERFHGYGPEQGYEFLRRAIVDNDYRARGIDVDIDEVFVSDGAKSDTGNICDIFAADTRVAVTDPAYPVYVDTNVMTGRAGILGDDGHWSGIEYLPCTAENGFVPELPSRSPDIIYLCYPNNPTGTTLTRAQLSLWVDYARANGSLILFDSAYEAYITEEDVPHSIYEIEGAREVAIEFRSFSKTAGFTGVRCGYTVIPRDLGGRAADGFRVSLNRLWLRRQTTKFNGASYVAQRGAAALYTPQGRSQTADIIGYYLANAAALRKGLAGAGFSVFGGVNSPYIWLKCPDGAGSWEFFDELLRRCAVVGTPGAGFGPAGEGYLRLTAFSSHEATAEATARIVCEFSK